MILGEEVDARDPTVEQLATQFDTDLDADGTHGLSVVRHASGDEMEAYERLGITSDRAGTMDIFVAARP